MKIWISFEMDNQKRWSLVVLVSTLQLVAFLVAALVLFGWFNQHAEHAMRRQCDLANASLATLSVAGDESRLESMIVPNSGFSAVFDSQGQLKTASRGYDKLYHESLHADQIQITDGAIAASLLDFEHHVGGQTSANHIIQIEDKQFIAHLRQVDSGLLVVAQDQSMVMNGYREPLATTRQLFYIFTIVFGLVGVGLILSILTRVEKNVSSTNSELEKQLDEKAKEVEQTQNAVIFGLAKLAENRDNDTGEHLERISSYVSILAKDLAQTNKGLSDEVIGHLSLASSLHDIGKVGIPDSILLKKGRLTSAERQIMEYHTVIGGECLDAIQDRLGSNPFMELARQVAYSHHERWDGTGYPHQLVEEEIPLSARIVSVADVYDALTSKRPYKRAMSHEESREIIVSGQGTQFDPDVVDAFLRHEDEFRGVSVKQKDLPDEHCVTGLQRLANSVELLSQEVHEVASVTTSPGKKPIA